MKSACWWRVVLHSHEVSDNLFLQEFTWVKSDLTARVGALLSIILGSCVSWCKLFWALYFSSTAIKTCTKHSDKVIETLIILWPFAGLAEVHPCLTVVGSQDWTLHFRCDLSSSRIEGRDHIPGDACPNSTQGAVGQGHVGGFCSAEHPPGPSCFPVDCFPPILYWWLGLFLLPFPHTELHEVVVHSMFVMFGCVWGLFSPSASQGLAGSFLHCPSGMWGW